MSDSAATARVRVNFEAELVLIGDEIPDDLDANTLRQAVQSEIGYTGVLVEDVSYWMVDDGD